MKTLFFGTERVYERYVHALHIYEKNGEVRVTALQAQWPDARTLDGAKILMPSNQDVISLCRHARMAGLKVEMPEPDYSSMPYDLTEEEFLQRTALLEAFPTPDGGIAWSSPLKIPMHYEEEKVYEYAEIQEHYSRPYTDVLREDGTIVRVKWQDPIVYRDPRLIESDFDEVGAPEDLKRLLLQQQEKEYRAQRKVNRAHLLEDLKKRLERAGIPYEEEK